MSDITLINDSEQSSLVTNGLAKNGELYLKKAGSTDAGAIVVYDSGSWRTFANEVAGNYSLDFDGTDDYLDISGISSAINSWTDVSWSGWYKGTDTSGYIFRASPAGWANPHIGMSISGGKLFGVVFDGSSQSSNTHQSTINNGSWHHVAVTFNGSTGVITTYVDSVACTTSVLNQGASISTGYTAANIGRRPSSSHLYTDGLIDEFAIWGSELSSSNITTIYNSGTPDDITTLSPYGWWRMGDNDSGTGTTITDQGSGGNNGTLTNGPTFSTDVPS